MNTGKGEVVFAHPLELDDWRRGLELTPAGRAAMTPSATDAGELNEAEGNDQAGLSAAAPTSDARPRADWLKPVAGYRRLFTVAVLTAAASGFWLWTSQQPVSFSVAGGALRVFNGSGRFLWSRSFDQPLRRDVYENFDSQGIKAGWVEDIDGDGDNEVVFMSDPEAQSSEGLYVFAWDGSVRFQHQRSRTIHYPEPYTGPWLPGRIFLERRPSGGNTIWLASHPFEQSACVLEKLDATGRVLGEYWNNGQISTVTFSTYAGRPVVMVGAVSDEFGGGSLAILDKELPSGAAPAVSPGASCRDCPVGLPLAFLVFPRTEIAVSHGGLARVNQIIVGDNGQIRVEVFQDPGTAFSEAGSTGPKTYYLLDSSLRITSAFLGQSYEAAYEHLLAKGFLRSPFVPSTERLFPVRRWRGDRVELITHQENTR